MQIRHSPDCSAKVDAPIMGRCISVTGGSFLGFSLLHPGRGFRGEVTPRLLNVLDTQSLPASNPLWEFSNAQAELRRQVRG